MLGACTVLLAADKAAAAVISLPFHTITADYCRPAPAASRHPSRAVRGCFDGDQKTVHNNQGAR